MLTNNYKPFIGGVPISIERLANGLREQGHEVFIFAPSYENQVDEENVVRYKSLKENNKITGKFAVPNIFDLNIERKFKELNIDIIHVHHPMLIGWTAIYLGKKYNIPVTFTYHTRYEEYLHNIKLYNALDNRKNRDKGILNNIENDILTFTKETLVPKSVKTFSNMCDSIFAPTKEIKNYLEDISVNTKISVMPTGLEDIHFIGEESRTREVRDKYIDDKKYLFCTVSRLTKEKNIEFIIDGIERLKEKVGDIFKLLIIGEGPLKEELKMKVSNLGMESNVEFLNNIPNENIGDYYRACDLFLFASKSETQGIVLIEAMAAKNPVVAVRGTGVVDIVENEVNGFMTDEDIDEWSDKIAYLLNNRVILKKISIGAYNTALNYSSEKIAKIAEKSYIDTIELYRNRGEGFNYEFGFRNVYK
ncbi:GDP-mannose-dependent alpha-(1-6)-phosphatidylinositol monomannoside mannosyltransferase [uncultured Clostridium sp.]|nr:GDP-mannose-dependent alpha-(1-6)-phosphatidylinositol monomannoside mannosyltransferase [uncultured Clostridium sp.]